MKRISLFLGHYGSGKTFLAVNYAIKIAKENKNVSIYDLDIVNPYFRTVDAKTMLDENNVELIVSPYAESNVDIPAMNSASYKMVEDKSRYAVVDIGGDDRGALALGRFREKILAENDYEAFFVVNCFRPETRDLSGAIEIKNEIETASKIKFTSIINNTNIGNETDENIILSGLKFCEELSGKISIPIAFTTVRFDLFDKVKNKIKNVMPIKPIEYGKWL